MDQHSSARGKQQLWMRITNTYAGKRCCAWGQRVIRYLLIERKAPGAWTVRQCEIFDNGGPDLVDVNSRP